MNKPVWQQEWMPWGWSDYLARVYHVIKVVQSKSFKHSYKGNNHFELEAKNGFVSHGVLQPYLGLRAYFGIQEFRRICELQKHS